MPGLRHGVSLKQMETQAYQLTSSTMGECLLAFQQHSDGARLEMDTLFCGQPQWETLQVRGLLNIAAVDRAVILCIGRGLTDLIGDRSIGDIVSDLNLSYDTRGHQRLLLSTLAAGVASSGQGRTGQDTRGQCFWCTTQGLLCKTLEPC